MGSDCIVDIIGNGINDLGFGVNEFVNVLNFVLDEVIYDLVLFGIVDIDGEVFEKFNIVGSVFDFGVELDVEDGFGFVGNVGKFRVRSVGKDGEVFGKFDQFVEVVYVDCLNLS